MHSSANKVKLPNIEEIEKLRGNYIDEAQEEAKTVDIEAMIRETQKKCDSIIADAQKKADAIEAQAKHDAEILKKQNAELGYQDGLSRGQMEISAQLDEQHAEFERQMDAMANYREQMFVAVKEHLKDCLKLLCRKIIFREYNEDDAVINEMISHYYSIIKDRTNLVLTVSKEDYSKLNLDTLKNKGIEIKVDETFVHGDLIISCDAEGINFGLNEQIEKMQDSIGA